MSSTVILDVVNSGSTSHLALGWKDADGVVIVVAPTDVQVKIKCITTNVTIRPWAALSGPAASMDLEITAAENALQNAINPTEERRVLVRATFGTSPVLTGDYFYTVRNVG